MIPKERPPLPPFPDNHAIAQSPLLGRVFLFSMRLCGYGVLFLIILVAVLAITENYFQGKNPMTWFDDQADHFDDFSMSSPDPVQFWSWHVEAPELFPISNQRFDTLMVQQNYKGAEWICAGLKNNQTVVYYLHSYAMRRIVANDQIVYCPSEYFGERRKDNSLDVRPVVKSSMERLSEKVGEQGIRDLLVIGKEFRKIRDTHYSRELLFDSILMATAWNKRHGEKLIDISDIPTTATYPLALK